MNEPTRGTAAMGSEPLRVSRTNKKEVADTLSKEDGNNVVDGLFAIADALNRIAENIATHTACTASNK